VLGATDRVGKEGPSFVVHTRPMASGSDDAAVDPPELCQRLEAERAAVEHWRRVAQQREEQFEALNRRPIVWALLAGERRVAPVAARARTAGRWLRLGAERVTLCAGALRRAGRRPPSAQLVVPRPVQPGPAQRVAIVVVGAADAAWASVPPPGVEVTRVAEPCEARAALARAVKTSAPDLVGVVAATTEPLADGWLDRLAGAIDGSVVAAVPLVVHPVRSPWRATPHDGLVRAAGVGLRLDRDGTPRAEALGAGTAPRLAGGIVGVDAATGAALLVVRVAYETAGGLAAIDDLDAATVELCARLREQDRRVVLVPAAVVVDNRPVRARRELRVAVHPTGAGWSAAIGRSGPLLRRAADPREEPPLRLALTVAAPSGKVASRWGDWHLAQALAGSLRSFGHEVRLQTADQADSLAGRACDVHVVLRGLQSVSASAGQHHVLWIVSHPEAIDDGELDEADQVLVASRRFAEHLRSRTDTPVEVMLQATDHRRFDPRPVNPAHRHDVTVVAKTRDVLRPVVADALAAGLRPAIYGGGWRYLVDPSLVVADHLDNDLLPIVYSSAGVVLNDHWGTMRAWGFVSNRLFDVLACGTPVISDAVDGLAELFDGAVLEYSTPTELRALVDEVLADPAAARERAARGRELVVAHHTMDRRARELIAALTAVSAGQCRP
jgi:glycosyltransferase involved in cell wall biosynthesis